MKEALALLAMFALGLMAGFSYRVASHGKQFLETAWLLIVGAILLIVARVWWLAPIGGCG